MKRRRRVLLSAYACEPNKGSEPEVGWNIVREVAKYNQVWVITRRNNRPPIEAALAHCPISDLRFVYFDLPQWARFWKRGQRGVQLYYYLWQIGAYFVARQLHREIGFDLCQHVTFVKYWAPSFVSLLPIPFIWGPVGGGETAPWTFWSDFSARGKIYELVRTVARWFGERDPFVRWTARRSALALATSEETALRLRRIGAPNVVVFSQVSLPRPEIAKLSTIAHPPDEPIRCLSIGRLLHWKGFHLVVRAFAKADLLDAEYWIVGEGPERPRLEALAHSLGIAGRVRFLGQLPRGEVLHTLSLAHVLIHPSLHDSGGYVVAEAMAAGRPVICLDLGGPAVQVTKKTGFVIPAGTPDQAVEEMSRAILYLARDAGTRERMGRAARQRVANALTAEG